MRNIDIFLSSTIAILLLSPVNSDLVQCIGADGHSEIEFSSMGACFSCIDEDGHVSDASNFLSTQQSHCGVCVDFPLTPSNLCVRFQEKIPTNFYVFAAPKFWSYFDQNLENTLPKIAGPPLGYKRIEVLKTIVLLI